MRCPQISIENYMEHVKGPDFPTGAGIHGVDGIYDMYSSGKGRFHVRSKCDVLDDSSLISLIPTTVPLVTNSAI